MEPSLLRRPVIDLLSGRSQCLFALNTAARRHESSYRRTKQRLNVKPDSSFLPSNNSPQQDHVVFNPPSSAPSVQHTPLIFLPKEDKRRQLFAATAARTPAPTRLPPVIQKFKPVGVRHHLTEKEIEEIRKLRSSDPFQWSAAKLARKFNCSMFFVKMCCEAPEEKKELERQKLEHLGRDGVQREGGHGRIWSRERSLLSGMSRTHALVLISATNGHTGARKSDLVIWHVQREGLSGFIGAVVQ